jgi:DNA polymerase-1
MKRTYGIVDGDPLCYLACAPRYKQGSAIQLDENGNKIPLEFTKEEDTKYFMQSWKNLEKKVEELKEKLFCNTLLMAVQDDTKKIKNYRKMMYPEYKMNRHKDPSKQNLFVPKLRKLLVKGGYAIVAEGREADDYVRTWALEARAAKEDYVVVSLDKDLQCIPGKFYNVKTEELIEISEWDALKNYYRQLLMGDSSDNIPGLPGIGPKTADKLLLGAFDEEEMQEIVVMNYLEKFEDDWYDMLLSNAKMLHIQTHLNDYFSFDSWPLVQELK